MSKAFVKETDDDEDEELEVPQIAGIRNYITPAGTADSSMSSFIC